MASWETFRSAAPELADAIRGRFEAHGLALVASLRRDGGPRISAVELQFGAGELWLGMMHRSVKALDLRRDPRLALHSATVDKDVTAGDAKVAGRAVEVTGDEFRAYLEVLHGHVDQLPPEPFHAFRVDVSEASMLRPAGDHLDIDIWTEAGGVRHVDRY